MLELKGRLHFASHLHASGCVTGTCQRWHNKDAGNNCLHFASSWHMPIEVMQVMPYDLHRLGIKSSVNVCLHFANSEVQVSKHNGRCQ